MNTGILLRTITSAGNSIWYGGRGDRVSIVAAATGKEWTWNVQLIGPNGPTGKVFSVKEHEIKVLEGESQ